MDAYSKTWMQFLLPVYIFGCLLDSSFRVVYITWPAVITATIRSLTLVMEQLGKEEAQSATVVNVDRTQVVEGTSTTLIVVVVMSNICMLLDVIALVC